MRRFAILFCAYTALSSFMATPSTAAIHVVSQVGLTFQPDTLAIDVGDTVEWHHSTGSHTVTNGTGPTDPNVGTLFDQPLTGTQPVVTYTFNVAGDVPYFCSPHFNFGMIGLIRVIDVTAAPESDGSNRTWAVIKALYR